MLRQGHQGHMNQWPPDSQPAVSMLILPGVLPPLVCHGHLSWSLTSFLLVICCPTREQALWITIQDVTELPWQRLTWQIRLAAFSALAPPFVTRQFWEDRGRWHVTWRRRLSVLLKEATSSVTHAAFLPDKNTPNRLRRAFTEIRHNVGPEHASWVELSGGFWEERRRST